MKGGRAIDLQQLMANPQLQRAFTERFTPLPPSMDVDGMAMVFTKAMLSTAANFAPGAKRSQEPAGWCASEETKTEMLAAWQERGAARELLSADPSNGNLRKPVKAAGKRLKRVRIEAVQRFLMEFDSQLGVRSKDGDQSGVFKHPNGMDFEGKKSCSSHYIKDTESRLPRDMEFIRDRWVQWFSSLLNKKSPTFDPRIVEKINKVSIIYLRS